MRHEEVIDGGIWIEAITAGARAGVFRRAARLNPKAKIWRDLADVHSREVATILAEAAISHGANGAGA